MFTLCCGEHTTKRQCHAGDMYVFEKLTYVSFFFKMKLTPWLRNTLDGYDFRKKVLKAKPMQHGRLNVERILESSKNGNCPFEHKYYGNRDLHRYILQIYSISSGVYKNSCFTF